MFIRQQVETSSEFDLGFMIDATDEVFATVGHGYDMPYSEWLDWVQDTIMASYRL